MYSVLTGQKSVFHDEGNQFHHCYLVGHAMELLVKIQFPYGWNGFFMAHGKVEINVINSIKSRFDYIITEITSNCTSIMM